MRLKIKWLDGWAYAHGTGPDGNRVRRSLKTQDPRQAEQNRASLEARLWEASLYGAKKVITFEQAALAYAEDGGDMRFIVRMAEVLNGQRLADITPKAIRDAARRAYPECSNATLNRQGITPARAVINYAHQQGWCAPIRVRAFPVEKPRRRAVGPDYLEQLRPHIPDRLYALMLFLQTTGRRVGEAIALKPANLDLAAGRVDIPKTKNGEAAIAYLTPDLIQILEGVKPRHRRVFGYVDRSSVYPTLRRACAKAGIEYLGTHQPGRHSFATHLEKEGWGATAIARAGGWKSVRLVSETYVHPENSAARATASFGKKLASKNDDASQPVEDKRKNGG